MSHLSKPQTFPHFWQSLLEYLVENFAEEITLDDLAHQANMSKFAFCRKFQSELGITPMRWLWNARCWLAKAYIEIDPSWNLTDVAFHCGFGSSAHFSRAFKSVVGVTPSQHRRDQLLAKTLEKRQNTKNFDQIFNANDQTINSAMIAAIDDQQLLG